MSDAEFTQWLDTVMQTLKEATTLQLIEFYTLLELERRKVKSKHGIAPGSSLRIRIPTDYKVTTTP